MTFLIMKYSIRIVRETARGEAGRRVVRTRARHGHPGPPGTEAGTEGGKRALMFLNGDGMRGGRAHRHIAGAPLIGERRTAPRYRFCSVRDEFPALYPVRDGGRAILGELYDVPMPQLRDLLASEPPELELSIVELENGDLAFGMVLRRGEHERGAHKDITGHGGWRAYRDAT